MAFCINCGQKLVDGAKFCHECGVAVGVVMSENKNQRKQEYIGKILKCPSCGATITETTAICPNCGVQITGKAAVNSVQNFKEQLMLIESTRKKGLGGALGVYTAPDPADTKKLSLIRNFPIPNSVDDILEFMMLAVANIDTSLSKNNIINKWYSMQQIETGATIGKTISNAWVSKMQQTYHKAEIAFPNDPAFTKIQKIYFDKMRELKIKI